MFIFITVKLRSGVPEVTGSEVCLLQWHFRNRDRWEEPVRIELLEAAVLELPVIL